MCLESKDTNQRKIKIIYEQTERKQISTGCESKPRVNITDSGFVRVSQKGKIGSYASKCPPESSLALSLTNKH